MALTPPPTVTQSGNVLTLTVTTQAGDRDQYEDVPGTVTVDPDGAGPVQPATVDYVAKRKLSTLAPIKVTDSSGRVWAPKDDNGLVATFTSTV